MEGNGKSNGTNGPPKLTEEEFLAFCVELDEAESEHASALAACKEPKKRIKDVKKRIAGMMSLDAFEKARADRLKPSYLREQEHEDYLRAMAWLGKPVGMQASFDFAPRKPGVAELHEIDTDGFRQGKTGHEFSSSWTPGTEQWARHETAYKRGKAEYDAELKEGEEALKSANGATGAEQQPRRRGRPPGSKNKTRGEGDGQSTETPPA